MPWRKVVLINLTEQFSSIMNKQIKFSSAPVWQSLVAVCVTVLVGAYDIRSS